MQNGLLVTKQYGGVRQYIPLKVNAAGVMPIIFAQALMFIPAYYIFNFSKNSIKRYFNVVVYLYFMGA